MRRIRYGIVLTIACSAMFAAGCGGGPTVTSTSGSAPAPAFAGGGESAADSARAVAPAERPMAEAKQNPAATDSVVSNVAATRQERQVIYTGSVTVRAKEVATAAQQAKQIVTEAGGYLNREESNSAGSAEDTALLEFKVPPAKYPDVLRRFGAELGRQLSVNQGTQDVTLQVADVESRLRSAQASLKSLRELLARADTIGQVLQVEREISSRESDLEALQAQQKELAAQVSMATLTLRLVGPVAVVDDPAEEPAGFLGGLKAGWAALVAFVKVALTAVGAVLPWLAVALPPTALIIYLVRRARARRPAQPPAVAAESGPEAG
ncbi:DUF4349 domain-containing protein [Nonomuraea maritima]|uniref:DUF4349 domain-containing protein n=1 Tax=Nonomuraea maritima TaxID=683260 RepID=UPI00371C4236